MMLCAVWTAVRLKRNLTVEGRLTQIFNLCKLTVLYLTFLQDIRITAVYGAFFLGACLVFILHVNFSHNTNSVVLKRFQLIHSVFSGRFTELNPDPDETATPARAEKLFGVRK